MGSSLAAISSRFASTVMVVRNPHRATQIFDQGVVVEGMIEARAHPLIVKRIEDLTALGNVSVIFIATKTTGIPSICADLKPFLNQLGAEGRPVRIVSYQNGIDPGREIIDLLDWPHVLRMVLRYGATLDEQTGVIRISMMDPPHSIGCIQSEHVDDCKRLARLLTDADFPTQYDTDIEHAVWIKAMLNAAMSPVAALVDSSIGEVLDSPASAVVRRLLAESMAVARAHGISPPDHFLENAFEMYAQGASHVPSMVEDIRKGRESEVGQLNRQILEHAKKLNVPVPTHETIDALIEAFDWRVYHAARSSPPSPHIPSTESPT